MSQIEIPKEEFRRRVSEYVGDDPKRRENLAVEMGVALSTVDRWVNGRSTPIASARGSVIDCIGALLAQAL
jgi:hypothetical protein